MKIIIDKNKVLDDIKINGFESKIVDNSDKYK